MTAQRDLKRIIRDRQLKTGESYTAARAHVMRARNELLGVEGDPPVATEPVRSEAVVLGLTPLPLQVGELENLRSDYEPYLDPDPYAPLWRMFTAKRRRWFEMDPIAWGTLPGLDIDDNPTCDAAELSEAGDVEGACKILMDVLGGELRCIDAHAHLGNLEFSDAPKRAMNHYEMGIRIAELSLPLDFGGVLPWGHLYNRPFLRCLHGYGLCLWRLEKHAEAQEVFERLLSLNPNDNQGARFCWFDVREGRSWAEAQAREEAGRDATGV